MPSHRLPTDEAQAEWVIPDPGNGGWIDVSRSGVCEVSSGATASTVKLPSPQKPGQWILLVCKAHGGGAMNVESWNTTSDPIALRNVNYTGNTNMTFVGAGEYILLIGVTVGTYLEWRAIMPLPEADAPTLT